MHDTGFLKCTLNTTYSSEAVTALGIEREKMNICEVIILSPKRHYIFDPLLSVKIVG